jgi:hypothetical protein
VLTVAPHFEFSTRIRERVKLSLVAEPADERFGEDVLHWLARRDVVQGRSRSSPH